jgi:hypothetical protein
MTPRSLTRREAIQQILAATALASRLLPRVARGKRPTA